MNTQSPPAPASTAPAPPTLPPPPLQLLSPPPTKPRKTRRNGVIARLPRLERDMVSRMIYDGIRYETIRDALDEHDIRVTVRNISNWKTHGGYDEYRQEQAQLLQLRLEQDALTDFLRPDPNELPEVGLQLAATRISQLFLRPDIQARLQADPKQFLPILSMLSRLSRDILNLQKYRDLRQTAGNPGYRREREKQEAQKEVELTRQVYSGELTENDQSPKPQPAPKPSLSPAVPQPAAPPAAATVSPIENQNSKIENSPSLPPVQNPDQTPIENPSSPVQNSDANPAAVPSPRGEGQGEGEQPAPQQPVAPIENQNSKTETSSPQLAPFPPVQKSDGNSAAQNSAPQPSTPEPIENQNSKIENPPSLPPVQNPDQPPIANQNPKAENSPSPQLAPLSPVQEPNGNAPAQNSAPQPSTPEPIENPNSKIQNSSSLPPVQNPDQPPTENQNSKIQNSPTLPFPEFKHNDRQLLSTQHCPKCQILLPEFWPDGSPPFLKCEKCGAELKNVYGNSVERCPACNIPLPPLLPNGQRPSPLCSVCGCSLYAPKTPGPHPPALRLNARVCMFCRTPIPWFCEGSRPSPYCAKCHNRLPRIVYSTAKPISPLPPELKVFAPVPAPEYY
ncbi:MAG TPA: hypothetical protein VN578_10930 [Candidatus Binatia bacterium]|nr:hypothetical protein [Candidatus Binatia bacterium]